MKIDETNLEGVLVISPNVFGDNRGWFSETYNKEKLSEFGIEIDFVQDNHSFSKEKHVLRGLHFQKAPYAQTKLVRCTKGKIYDVAIDIRKGSPTYGEWFGIELSQENHKQLLVPQGFAHGFLTLTDDVEVQYKVDNLYNKESDRSIKWDDPDININWPENINPILSEKDANALSLNEIDNNFEYKG